MVTRETARIIGATLGLVTKSKEALEMRRGNSMRVMVAVDIFKPLYRGRKVTWDQIEKGWVFSCMSSYGAFVIHMGICLTMIRTVFYG